MSEKNLGAEIPPSASRLAAAARSGIFPRSPLLSFGAGVTSLGVSLLAFSDVLFGSLTSALSNGVHAALRERLAPADAALSILAEFTFPAFALIALPALAAFTVSFAAAAIAQRRGRGATSVDLPSMPRLGVARAVLYGAVIFVAIFSLARLIGVPSTPAEGRSSWVTEDAFATLSQRVGTVALVIGTSMCLAALAEISLIRIRLLEALSLSRSEAARERRAQGANPRVKAAVAASHRKRSTP